MPPSGKLETKGHQVRSLGRLVGKSEMRSTCQAAQSTGTGPAAAEDAPAASRKGWEKTVMDEKREILCVLRQPLDCVLKDRPL